jgi:hypothetical protein
MNDSLSPEEREAYAFIRDARRARQAAEQKRRMAAERTRMLEVRLREAAEDGMRAEIARQVGARRRLRALLKVTADTQKLIRLESAAAGRRDRYRAIAAALVAALGASAALALGAARLDPARANVDPPPALQGASDAPLALKLSCAISERAPQ